MNILILTRVITRNSNLIYNYYTKGIQDNYPDTTVIDYFDLYFSEGKGGFEKHILQTIQEKKIDLVFINFVSGDITFSVEFLQLLSSKCFMMMNFYDNELFFEPIDRYYAQCADLVIIPNTEVFTYSYKLLGINAKSVLSLYDTSMYKNQDIEKDIDISFVGDVSKKSRSDLINYLIDNGINVEVYGRGSKRGNVSFEKMIEVFNRSKINLNFSETVSSREFNANTNTNYKIVPKIVKYMTQLKGRSIEISLCGSFVLTQDATGIEELFTSDEIDTFASKEELLQKVKYYLEHEDIRESMAQSAYEKANVKYDASKAFKNILDDIKLSDAHKKTVYIDKEFSRNYMTYHTLYLFNFLFKFKISHFLEELKMIKLTKINIPTALKYALEQFKYIYIKK